MNTAVRALAATILLVAAVPAIAAPGLGSKVYGATVEAGVTEVEARYGRLVGDPADGEDGFVLEFARGFSSHFYGAVLAEFEREPGQDRRLGAIAIEAIVPVGRIEPIGLDVALYGEYAAVRNGADVAEAKLLLQHKRGRFDSRLNLVAAKPLHGGQPFELEYAASADFEVVDEFRLGFEAFGDLGSSHYVTTRAEHYIGPVIKTEIEHFGPGELSVQAGYLFAIGRARDEANGQVRIGLEYEFKL